MLATPLRLRARRHGRPRSVSRRGVTPHRRSAIPTPMLFPADRARVHRAASTPTRARPISRGSRRSLPGANARCGTAVAQRLKAALIEGRAARRATAAERPPRPQLRGAALPHAGRDHSHAVRAPVGTSIARRRRRTPSAWRWWRPAATAAVCWRPAPTSISCSCCPTSRPRGASRSPRHSLLPVGHGAQGRPRDALGRRVHPPGQGRHDHPHRAARGALPARRPRAVRRVGHTLRQVDRAQAPRRNSSPPSLPSARSGCAAPASRAIWSSRT